MLTAPPPNLTDAELADRAPGAHQCPTPHMNTIDSAPGTVTLKTYPAGALVRVSDICRTETKPGLLPIAERTWFKWVKAGKAPKGIKLGGTTAWRIEDVLAMGQRSQASSP